MELSDYDERISEFLLEYVNYPTDKAYTPSGNLTSAAIKQAVQLLLQENVFSSKNDMRIQAMKDYKIVLPETIFE